MSDRCLKVVDHKVEDWGDFLFRIPSELSEGRVLLRVS
jgi:hypothetical protein